MAAETINTCDRCGLTKAGLYNFWILCGADNDKEKKVIEYYFRRGFKYKTILDFLSEHHDINICMQTLKSRLKKYGLSRRSSSYNMEEVRQELIKELDGPACMGGYRSMWHSLQMKGFQVPRHVVETLMRELDPTGCELRKARRLKRIYTSAGPNYCWHLDGYDKLKPFGFPIHGCIDGWSRKIMWLKVARSNNNPEIPATFFIECVREFSGCPVKVRSDCGTENGTIAAIQCEFRDTADAHVFGKSTANQRIEGWWSYLRRNRTNWWINYFKDLVEKDIYHPGDELEDEALWYCFSQLLQNDLDVVKEHWNTHRIRQSRHETIPGRPDELYFFPQNHGGNANLLSEVPGEKLQYVTDNVLTSPDEDNISQEYFDYILDSSELEHPTGWKDAEDLYTKLIEIAQPVQN